jgi:hypothetical protein
LTWCVILFILGVLAFLDSLFTPPYGDIFIKVDSLLFMVISLGMLIRLRAERSQEKAEERETPVPRQARDGELSRTVGVEN